MDEEEDERAVVALARDRPGVRLVPGSWPIEADCGHRAWIAPSTRAHFQGRRDAVRYLCNDGCFQAALSKDEAELRIIPGTEAEAASVLGDAIAERLMLRLKASGFAEDSPRGRDGRPK